MKLNAKTVSVDERLGKTLFIDGETHPMDEVFTRREWHDF